MFRQYGRNARISPRPSFSSSPNYSRPAHQAYIIPYRSNAEGNYEVLVGEKRIINYKAITSLSLGINTYKNSWAKVMNVFRHNGIPLNGNGRMIDLSGNPIENIGARFAGCLSPSGGKKCFFGGRQDSNESPKQTAVREFLEELGLEQGLAIDLNLLTLVKQFTRDNDGWNGYYYSLNIDKCPALASVLNITNENERISKIEQEWNLGQVYNYPKDDAEKFFPEVRNLEFVKTTELLRTLKSIDEAYLDQQLREFCTFIIETVDNALGFHEKPDPSASIRLLARHFVVNEKTDGNEKAAQALLSFLSPTAGTSQSRVARPRS